MKKLKKPYNLKNMKKWPGNLQNVGWGMGVNQWFWVKSPKRTFFDPLKSLKKVHKYQLIFMSTHFLLKKSQNQKKCDFLSVAFVGTFLKISDFFDT